MDFLQSLDLLERHGMLRVSGEDEYRFSHDLVRPAVLTTLSAPRRKLTHLRIAEALQAARSAVPRPSTGWRVAATAASRAFLARGDLDSAARAADEALDNAERRIRPATLPRPCRCWWRSRPRGAGRRPSLYLERLNQVAAAEVSASARAASERALAASSRNAAPA